MREPLRILMLAANPIDRNKLALKTERELLRNKMSDNIEAGSCDLKMEWATRAEDLKQALRENQPHIVHFSGHGHDESICLEDDDRKSRPLSKRELGLLFNQSRNRIRVVVLNACYSARQVDALTELVDFVIGTTVPITDAAALRFTNDFYRAIATGGTVREAFSKAKANSDDPSGHGSQYEMLVRPGADETTPLLPPSANNLIKVRIGKLKAKQANVGDTITEGAIPLPVARSSHNENTQIDFQCEDMDLDTLNAATDIWKQSR